MPKTSTKKQSAAKQDIPIKTIAYKGLSKDMKCCGFQYEVGKKYKQEGDVVLCQSGFHSCVEPLDVFGYYTPGMSRFCEVEIAGNVVTDDDQQASSEISVLREIPLHEFVGIAADYRVREVLANIVSTESDTGYRSAATNTGDQSAATNTGYRSAATNTGYQSAATNTGDQSAATNTGYRSAATNTGDQSAATNTGDQSAATNTGNRSAATNTGYQSTATNTGNRSAATNTSDRSAATNTGNRSAATNTGNRSAATNTGYRSAATNTGDQSAATNTGYQSAATNTGYLSAATVEGKESVAVCIGYQSKAKASADSWIVLAERDEDGTIRAMKCGKAGRDMEPDIFYQLKNGEFVKCE